ncbi:hypothetical protein ACFRFH_00450 [Leifsonia sp. NPDC056824]|uniref:hypothetical protein n=1 Tax=Leifsonia sp. NPDC056824 TaxID=3345953 RepID=UPI0036906A06
MLMVSEGKGLAIAALITSIVGTVVGVVVFFAVVSASFNIALGGTDTTVKAPAGSASAAPSQASAATSKVGTPDNPAPLGSSVVSKDSL